MRAPLPTAAFRLLALPVLAFASLALSQANTTKTNIILIVADDLGYETIGANGGESYQTPHLDRLAEDGVRFEHCYSQPLCTPSRVKLMTGKYNVRNYHQFGVLPRTETTFAHLLKNAGYRTCIAGKWQLGSEKDSAKHFGFDEALLWQHTRERHREGTEIDTRYENPRLEHNGKEIDYNNGEYSSDVMVDFISRFIEENRENPFFVYYPMILTHCPFVPTPDSNDWNPKSLGSPTYKGDPRYFGDMVKYMDKLVGRILKKVDEQGLAENTVILFTGDNGADRPVVSLLNGRKVPGAKGRTTNGGTHVPLIGYGPGFAKSTVTSDLVDFSDFLPTICEISGVQAPEDIDGQSFLPQLQGQKGSPRDFVYCWFSINGENETAKVFARTQKYKLYRGGRFFDVSNDPKEKNPLDPDSLNPSQLEIRNMLRSAINKYEAFRNSDEQD